MSMFKNDGVHAKEYIYDFAVDGGAVGDIELSSKANSHLLPEGAIVKAVYMKVVTAFTSGGSATLTVGNAADKDGYMASIAVASLTANAGFSHASQAGALLWDNTNDASLAYIVTSSANTQNLSITIGTAAMTAGKAVIVVEYYYPSI